MKRIAVLAFIALLTLQCALLPSRAWPSNKPAGTAIPLPRLSSEAAAAVKSTAWVELRRWGKGVVSDFAFSPDGSELAVAASSGVYLFDPDTLAERLILDTQGAATALAWSPDGKRLAASGKDYSIYLFSRRGNKPPQIFTGPNATVLAVAFTPDGKGLLAATATRSMHYWEINTGGEPRIVPLESARCLAVSPDSKLAAVCAEANKLVVWDLVSWQEQPVKINIPGDEPVISATFSPDGAWLAAGGMNGHIALWKLGDIHETIVFNIGPYPATRLLFSKNLPGINVDHIGEIAHRIDLSQVKGLEGSLYSFWSAQRSPRDGRLVNIWPDGSVAWWLGDGPTSGPVHLDGFFETPEQIHLLAGKQQVAALTQGGRLNVWSINDGKLVYTRGLGDVLGPSAISPDETTLAVQTDSRTIELRRLADAKRISRIAVDGTIENMAFSPGGGLLAGTQDGQIYIWRVDNGEELDSLPGTAFVFAPNGKQLALATPDGSIELRGLTNLQVEQVVSLGQLNIRRLDITPDGSALFIWNQDPWGKLQVRRLNLADGQFVYNLWQTGQSPIDMDIFAPAGLIATAKDQDTGMDLWRLSDGYPLGRIRLGQSAVVSLNFAATQPLLAIGCSDGTVRVWGVPAGTKP